MRHKNSGRKFDRNTSSRRAMLRNLTANLILNEKIETTDAKAKELRRVAERLITKARRLGAVAYTAQTELSPADRARRLSASRMIAAYIPRFGVRVEGERLLERRRIRDAARKQILPFDVRDLTADAALSLIHI